MRCANEESLNAYLDKKDKEEQIYESMIQELVDELQIDYEDLHSRFDKIASRYDFPLKFEDFIKEEL